MNNIKQIDVSGHRYDICDANMRAAVTDEYDVLTAYTMGDFCIFNNVLYRCLEDTTGAWQEEKWEKKTLAEMYKEMEIMTHISDAFSALKKYTAGKYCIYENTLYRFTGTKEAGEWDPAKVVATSVDAEISALNENFSSNYYRVYENTKPFVDTVLQKYTVKKSGYYLIVTNVRVFGATQGTFPCSVDSYDIDNINIFDNDPVSSQTYKSEYSWATLVSVEKMTKGTHDKYFRVPNVHVENFDTRTTLYWLGVS